MDRAWRRYRDQRDPSALLREVGRLQRISTKRYNTYFEIAYIYAGLGDKDHALAWYEKAY